MSENPVPHFSGLSIQTVQRLENINDLPDKLLAEIFSYMDWKDLQLSVRCVCKSWKNIMNKERVWNDVTCRIKRKYSKKAPDGEDLKIRKMIPALETTPMIQHITATDFDKEKIELLIRTVCTHCPHLHTLLFDESSAVNRTLLGELLENCPYIEKLSIYLSLKEAQECINLLGASEHIQCLFLNSVYPDKIVVDMKPLADGCPNLNKLIFPTIFYKDTDLIYFINKKSHQLNCLEFNGKYLLPNTILSFSSCKCLKRIDFHAVCGMLHQNFVDALRSSPGLNVLSLTICGSFLALSVIESYFKITLPNIKELHLYIGPIKENVAVVLKNSFPNVERLELRFEDTEEDSDIAELLKLENLVHLELWNYAFPFPDEWVVQLEKCSKLESLNLCGSDHLLNSQLSKIISSLQLKKLNISCCNDITSHVLADIAKCYHLKYLNISGCHFFADRVIEMLTQMRLNVIIAFNCNITADNVKNIMEHVITVKSNH